MKQFFCSRWRSVRLASLFHENTVKNEDFLLSNALQFRYGSIVQKKKFDLTSDLIETYKKYTLIQSGDIMINGLNLNYDFITQRVALVPSTGIITSAYICLRPRNSVNYRFYTYYLKALDALKVFNGLGTGIRLTLSYDSIKNMVLPLPPREEQDQIVRYLDWQVSKINRLIAAKRKEIDAIHDMEHLYIDHVFSEIANQKTIRLKYLVEQFVDCPHETPEYCKDGDYCVIRTADQDYGYLRSETLMYRLTESEYINRIRRAPLNAGDIVYGREGERWGLACVIPESEKFCLGQRIMQFVCNKQMVTPEYVMWALNSSYVRNQGILDTMGSTSPHVNISTIINFKIPYTSREHQHTLVSKIECTMQKYRQLCERIENEIQLLHDLRTRLISDVVTGQVDVRGIKVPDDEYINNEITEEEFEEESENNEEE